MNHQSKPTVVTGFGTVFLAVSIFSLPLATSLVCPDTETGSRQNAVLEQAHTGAVINDETTQAFFEQTVPGLMEQHHIPGAVVAVVKDGQPLFARGYGFSNLEKQSKVDPETTLFRIASVTKLFTWTAVMQLVEHGQLELDRDVNDYLADFQIPDRFPDPVTTANLMSHAAGFEDRGLIGTLTHTPEGVGLLRQFLIDQQPKRVRPAGTISAYSNYGAVLAGHVVAEISGLSYEDYVREHIFDPLGMKQATFSTAPPHDNLATGYLWREGAFHAAPDFFVIPTPEGGINASATSMSRFMNAHLNEGQIEGNAILEPETLRQMHRQSFTHHPQLPGWAHGFQENRENGYRLLEHGGRIGNFTNLLILVPSQRLGLFMSFNSHGGSAASRELKKDFFDRFLPVDEKYGFSAFSTTNSTQLAGYYAPCRSSQSTMAKLGILMQASRVSVAEDHSISFLGRSWIPCDEDLFRSVDNDELLACRRDGQGRGDYVFIDTFSWQRLPWYHSPVMQLAFVSSCLLLFSSVVISWLVSGFRFRNDKLRSDVRPRWSMIAWRTAVASATVNLVFVGSLVMILSGDLSALEFGIPLSLRLLLVLPIVFAVLAAATLIFSLVSWKQRWWSGIGRACYSTVSVSMLSFVGWLGSWNLLGWWF